MLQLRFLPFVFVALLCCVFAVTGCSGGKDAPAKTSFDEKDKQQIEELNKQRVDEWGRKVK